MSDKATVWPHQATNHLGLGRTTGPTDGDGCVPVLVGA